MIERHDAHLAILGSVRHVVYLRVNGRLDTLDTRNVSHIAIRCVHILIGAIAKLAHLVSKLLEMIATQIVLASDGLCHTHRTGHIEAKDDRYVLSAHAPIFHLGCSLEQVSDLVGLGDLLLFDHHLVLQVAELACPQLAARLVHPDLAVLVEDTLAPRAVESVTSCQLTLVLQALEAHLCHICVKLLLELADLLSRLGLAHDLLLSPNHVTLVAAVVTQIELTVQVILIHLTRRVIPLQILLM